MSAHIWGNGSTYPFQMPAAGHQRAALAAKSLAAGRGEFLCVGGLPRLHPAAFHSPGNRQTARRGVINRPVTTRTRFRLLSPSWTFSAGTYFAAMRSRIGGRVMHRG